MRAPNGEKVGKRFIVWTKIVYHHVCMINTDKGQEGIANIIEARNKYKMLHTCMRRIAAHPEVSEEKLTVHQDNSGGVKISVKLKVMLDKFYERLAERENICD